MAEIIFSDSTINACVRKVGGSVSDLSAGTRMRIGDNEGGEIEYALDEVVPAGKSWHVELTIVITETDV